MNDLGKRMKENYEFTSKHKLVRRMPVIVRLDGKAFHTYTRNMKKPFDADLMRSMVSAANHVMRISQGAKLAYIQSDEVSILFTDYESLQTCAYFDYSQSKIESVTASVMTAYFNRSIADYMSDMNDQQLALFDARAFNIPREEVVNYFLWRAKDWERNSLSMYCNNFYSPKEMHGKNKEAQHELLYAKGKNWTKDLSPREKNGTWIYGINATSHIKPEYEAIAQVIDSIIYPAEKI